MPGRVARSSTASLSCTGTRFLCLAMFCCSVVPYNVLSLTKADRWDEVTEEMRRFTFVGLMGAQRKASEFLTSRIWCRERLVLGAGWMSGSGTNKSAGVALQFGRAIKENDVKNVWLTPRSVMGRGIAAKVRIGCKAMLPIVMYYPPGQ